MGVEFIFSPLAVIIVAGINIGLVLAQWMLCPEAFGIIGLKKVMRGYVYALTLSIVAGVFYGKGILRDSYGLSIITCEASLTFISLGLLPATLLLVNFRKMSRRSVFFAGVFLPFPMAFVMIFTNSLDRVIELGITRWLSKQTLMFVYFAAVSAAFATAMPDKK